MMELEDGLEMPVDREVHSDAQVDLIRTVEQCKVRSTEVALRICGERVTGVSRQVDPLSQSAVNEEGRTQVAGVRARTGATLHHVEGSWILGVIQVPAIIEDEPVTHRLE